MKQGLLSNVLIFVTGAAIGSVVTWKLMKMKYEQTEYEYYSEEDDEADSDSYSESKECQKVGDEACKGFTDGSKNVDNQIVTNYHKILKQTGYSGEENKKEEEDVDKPYVITPDEFAELDGYNTITLYYFADGVVTDEEDNIIDDADDIVGEEALAIFEEEDYDSVYVRNDARKTDYEILRDLDKYSDKYRMEV